MNYKIVITVFLLLSTLFIIALGNYNWDNTQYTSSEPKNIQNMNKEQLWNLTVTEYLSDDLWTPKNMYDAGHYLMVPLHAAFYLEKEEWQKQFSNHFKRFVEEYNSQTNNISTNQLQRFHYFYLASRFIVLSNAYGKSELIPKGLTEILFNEVEEIWTAEPNWPWDKYSFEGKVKDRLMWKLNTNNFSKKYYTGIIDLEFFLFAIAADLRQYERLTNNNNYSWKITLTEILNVAYKVFNKRVVHLNDGGWLFQPGVFSDHRDYLYVGNNLITKNMEPKQILNIAMDSSHSHRFALWLQSLNGAYNIGEEEFIYYNTLIKGLEVQFFNKVIVNPTEEFSAYRTNNFMDGRNGVYRWEYETQGENNGYGPYELSGTFVLGWWSFLDSPNIRDVYRDMSKMFPLPDNVIKTYVGPNTARDRHHLVKVPNYYKNGFAQLITRLASEIKTSSHLSKP